MIDRQQNKHIICRNKYITLFFPSVLLCSPVVVHLVQVDGWGTVCVCLQPWLDSHQLVQMFHFKTVSWFCFDMIHQAKSSFTVCTECLKCPTNVHKLWDVSQFLTSKCCSHHIWECADCIFFQFVSHNVLYISIDSGWRMAWYFFASTATSDAL